MLKLSLRPGTLVRAAAVIVTCAALAGCGGIHVTPGQAIGQSAKLSSAIAHATQRFLGRWCAPAFHDGGRHLTPAQARTCLRRARSDYLGVLRRAGFDPARVVQGGG